MRVLIPVIAAGIGVVLLTGCSSYNRKWRAALAQPIPTDSIAGPWEGHWISDVNGHKGRLRCIIIPGGDGLYDAQYHAKYRRILSFGYTVPLRAEETENRTWKFSGEADLGKLAGGVYTYEGSATPSQFFSTYHSKYDHGKFELSRPLKGN